MYSKENGKEQVVVVMAGAEYRKEECLEGKRYMQWAYACSDENN